jgi:hypothetical protein
MQTPDLYPGKQHVLWSYWQVARLIRMAAATGKAQNEKWKHRSKQRPNKASACLQPLSKAQQGKWHRSSLQVTHRQGVAKFP